MNILEMSIPEKKSQFWGTRANGSQYKSSRLGVTFDFVPITIFCTGRDVKSFWCRMKIFGIFVFTLAVVAVLGEPHVRLEGTAMEFLNMQSIVLICRMTTPKMNP